MRLFIKNMHEYIEHIGSFFFVVGKVGGQRIDDFGLGEFEDRVGVLVSVDSQRSVLLRVLEILWQLYTIINIILL